MDQRTPQRPEVPAHVPVDPRTLQRVLDGLTLSGLESERAYLETRSKLSDNERARLESIRAEIMRCA